MINNTQSCESDFMAWLSQKVSPAKLSELYWFYYMEIESSCRKVRILKMPLFETTDYEIICTVQRYIEYRYRLERIDLITAGRYYLEYTKEMYTKKKVKMIKKLCDLAAHNKARSLERQLQKELKKKLARNRFRTTLTFLMRQVKCTDGKKVKQILEQARWAKLQYGHYYYVEGPQQEMLLDKEKAENITVSEIEELPDAALNEQNELANPAFVLTPDEPEQIELFARITSAQNMESVNPEQIAKVEKFVLDADMNGVTDKREEEEVVKKPLDLASYKETEEKNTNEENRDAVDEQIGQDELIIDFNKLDSFAHTKPCSFTYFEENKGSCSSWTELYVSFFAALYEDYPHLFRPGMSFSVNKGRVELAISDEAGFMAAPKDVPGTDYAIETNISATDIVRKMKYLLDFCSVDYENVVIKYRRRTSAVEASDTVIAQPTQRIPKAEFVDRISFYNYLIKTQNLSKATSQGYSSAIGSCETFAREHHYESWRLYTSDLTEAKATVDALFCDEEFIEYNNRRHNQPKAAIKKLLAFISDGGKNIGVCVISPKTTSPTPIRKSSYRNEAYEKVLKEKFKNGFRLHSVMELGRFKKSYANMHEVDVKESDAEIVNIIRRLCITCDDRAYYPDVLLSPELKAKLLDYIEKCFDDGKTTIYYQALCTEFAKEFIDYPLHNNPDALKVYLSDVGYGKFYINRTCISKEANVTTDPLTEIRECLKEFGRPVKFEELFAALPHLSQSKIKSLLAVNAEFVRNGQGAYFHESTVRLSDEELENIASIIEQTIEEKDFIGGNELYDQIRVVYPYIIAENSVLSVYGFRDALKYKFGDRFSFKGNIISAAGKELAMADVFANYARKHDSFTLTELETLAHELASTIYFDSVYENSLRISREQFVSKYRVQFNVPEVDAAMDRICPGDYMAIKQVNNFAVFPYVGFPWNSFLLEHYVAAYSKKYTLLHSGFKRVACAGAIVKRSANINSFDDFIVELLKNTDVELKEASVLQMLVQEGYLVIRKYANIEGLIIRAKAQRNRKETD